MDLSINEKRLLAALGKQKTGDPTTFAPLLSAGEDAVVQYAHLLADKGLAVVDREVIPKYRLTEEGLRYRDQGLPERQLLDSFSGSTPMDALTAHPLSRIGIGQMRKKGWVLIRNGVVEKTADTGPGDDERALMHPENGGPGMDALIRRGLAVCDEDVTWRIGITPEGELLVLGGLDTREEIGTLSRDQILSGEWKELLLRRYDVTRIPRRVYPGKVHPYQHLIDEMRQILLEMGFTEIFGEIVQSSFWNFDALFQPQDHPAREMQDTFYLSEQIRVPPGYERVRDMHEHGGDTSSTGWGGNWSREKAELGVLRTHTTCLSIQHLAAHPEPPVKAFCLGRVYRREAIDPTHLPEFEQLEGVVMDPHVSFRNLLGFLREFYGRMGFETVRFRPAYFPYTEPSVEPEVYVEGLGWVEMGGAGVFRQEVTAPWGITCPVLAWGLGVSRIAMLNLGLKDLRMLYRSDIQWIRESPALSPDDRVRRRC